MTLDASIFTPGSRSRVLTNPPTGVPHTIVSLDPGRTTGIAIATTSKNWVVAETGDILIVWRVLNDWKPKAILFERFHAENRPLNDDALDIRGIVKLYQLYTLPAYRPLIHWQPREAKTGVGSDAALRALGLWLPGMQHGRDALRHLIWHLVTYHNNTELIQWTKESRTTET